MNLKIFCCRRVLHILFNVPYDKKWELNSITTHVLVEDLIRIKPPVEALIIPNYRLRIQIVARILHACTLSNMYCSLRRYRISGSLVENGTVCIKRNISRRNMMLPEWIRSMCGDARHAWNSSGPKSRSFTVKLEIIRFSSSLMFSFVIRASSGPAVYYSWRIR